MRRVAGPELMLEVFKRKEFSGYIHCLYGGKPGVAEDLCATLTLRFAHGRIVATYTPPFHESSLLEREDFVASVRQAKTDIVWVGIRTPKQERFMHSFLPHLDPTFMFGVGAAFDFHPGRLQDSPALVRHCGLQWMHRLLKHFLHLWKRHLRNNPAFLWRTAIQFVARHPYLSPVTQYKSMQVTTDTGPLRNTGSEL